MFQIITYKKSQRAVLALISLLYYSAAQAQYLATPAELNNTNLAPGSYYNETSITFKNGFQISGSTGAYTFSIGGCVPLNTQPSNNQNYIITSTPRKSGINPSAAGLTACDVMQAVQYFDGLGRPLQTVQVKGSPTYRDVVQPIAYDAFGREAVKYLPYTAPSSASDGSYKTTAIADQSSFYANPSAWNAPGVKQIPVINGISPASSVTNFESSPLNRVTEQGAPGSDWQPAAGHTMKMEYATNTASGGAYAATLYTVTINSDQSRTLTLGNANGNYYGAGQLYVTVSKDENWTSGKYNTTEEYKDKESRVVLKRTFNQNTIDGTTETLSTYYVYDDLGNLAFVLPPNSGADAGISSAGNQTTLDKLCYQYQYDGRNRLINKHLPGKDWEEMIYNKIDQVVLTQDGVQRGRSERGFVKYDGIGRVIMTGVETNHTSMRAAIQNIVDGQPGPYWETRKADQPFVAGYTNVSSPSNTATINLLTVNYYDNYTGIPDLPAYAVPSNASMAVTGLLTANKTRILNPDGSYGPWLWTVNYYDDRGRVINTKKQHYLAATAHQNNYDEITTSYNFNDQPVSVTRSHYTNGATGTSGALSLAVIVSNRYDYDQMGRKTKTYQKTGTSSATEIVLSANTYNEIGQLMQKSLHKDGSSNYLQNTGYAYNERGWLKTASSPEFSMELKYQDAINGMIPQYNGNIANQLFTNSTANTFNYNYDKVNRLISGAAAGMSEVLSYDKVGNIVTLSRDGGAAGTYEYLDGNRLNRIIGAPLATGLYGYDLNGNATTDGRTGKTFSYNMLNLPQAVSGGISYTYTAAGEKLRKQTTNVTTDYVSGIQYNNGAIDFVQTEEGIARNNAGNYSYEYNLKDHLGNTRATFYKNPSSGSLQVIQRDDYYAFGKQKAVTGGTNKYLYNGKELQEDLGQYDYGARFYDPVIARWTSVDPKAETSRRFSPYVYGDDNPIRNIDPDGMETQGCCGTPITWGISVARSILAWAGYTTVKSNVVRKQYVKTVSSLDKSDGAGRTAAKVAARENTPAVMREVAENMKPIKDEASRIGGTASKTNTNVTNMVENLDKVGKVGIGVGVAFSAYNIATADDKPKAVVHESGAWVGAIAGGEAGAEVGAGIGVWFGGGGAVPGAIIGGVVGAAIGGWAGGKTADDAYNNHMKPKSDDKQKSN